MIAGRLNKPILIEHSRATGGNFLGEEIKDSVELITGRADVVWGSGRRDTAELDISYPCDVTFIVWIYLWKRIAEGDMVAYMGKRYRIIHLEPEPDTKILYIKAQSE